MVDDALAGISSAPSAPGRRVTVRAGTVRPGRSPAGVGVPCSAGPCPRCGQGGRLFGGPRDEQRPGPLDRDAGRCGVVAAAGRCPGGAGGFRACPAWHRSRYAGSPCWPWWSRCRRRGPRRCRTQLSWSAPARVRAIAVYHTGPDDTRVHHHDIRGLRVPRSSQFASHAASADLECGVDVPLCGLIGRDGGHEGRFHLSRPHGRSQDRARRPHPAGPAPRPRARSRPATGRPAPAPGAGRPAPA